ncbi:ribosome-recycling factor, mitochondrial-like [Anneissia japonica]|uniref:ribosome-recycling factor, mitochondrial-like n=1 Tax=Anneissia japonica TaxID=1529436 RepID=UPI001425AFFC|nr:ribosome-recycling factor, mitochondrial-like [Anneissia japonica]
MFSGIGQKLVQLSTAHFSCRVSFTKHPHLYQQIGGIQQIYCYHESGNLFAKKGKKNQPKVDVSRSIDEDILNLDEVNTSMSSCIEKLKDDFVKKIALRTAQGALDHIVVKTNDGKFPLNQLGQISAKSPHLLVVNIYSQYVKEAAKAIQVSGMNLNPKIEGTSIQVPIPKVTKEHREALAKTAKEMCDKTKVDLRNNRSKFISRIKKHSASKDVLFQLEKQVSQISDNFNERADFILKEKTKELLENT